MRNPSNPKCYGCNRTRDTCVCVTPAYSAKGQPCGQCGAPGWYVNSMVFCRSHSQDTLRVGHLTTEAMNVLRAVVDDLPHHDCLFMVSPLPEPEVTYARQRHDLNPPVRLPIDSGGNENLARAWFGIACPLNAAQVQAYCEEMVERWPRNWRWNGARLMKIGGDR